MATTAATAAAVVDFSDIPTPAHLGSLASINSGLSCMLAATLLTSTSAHLGSAAAQLRPPQPAADPAE
ncbi:hypothetical protein [Kitasatospora griseola]|uniref:hypothetical protein n=1 Tax=Kitasatospora griseola TaxID=2064 RepID=UPI00342085F7